MFLNGSFELLGKESGGGCKSMRNSFDHESERGGPMSLLKEKRGNEKLNCTRVCSAKGGDLDETDGDNLHYLHRMLVEDSCMFGEDFGGGDDDRQFLMDDDDRAAAEEIKSTMSPLLKGEMADYNTFLSKEQERQLDEILER